MMRHQAKNGHDDRKKAVSQVLRSLTAPEDSAVEQYLRDVARYQLITAEEEKELGRRAQRGDLEAMQKLCQANLRFVISVAKDYRGRGLPFSDLIQQGNLGLATAASKFDPDRGVKFISYAVWWIRQAIFSALAHYGRSIRLPTNRAAEIVKIGKMREALKAELGREPTSEEIAERLDMKPDMVEMLEAIQAGEVRLDAPIGESKEGERRERFFIEGAPGEAEAFDRRLLREEIEEALTALRERDALVLRLYYGLGGEQEHTLEEIGTRLGVTRERIRQLRDRALKELREGGKASALESFEF